MKLLYTTLSGDGDGTDAEADDSSTSVDVVISNPAGLHARPATLVVEVAKAADSEITITKGDKSATGRSIMSVLALGATVGDTVTVAVSGDDANETLDAVIEILTSEEG
jgi:phosphotransferase system HPr (HPr) family protein